MNNKKIRGTNFAGGLVLILGGILLYCAQLIVAFLPRPPAAQALLTQWTRHNALQLSVSNELFFFAILCLIPAIIVLYQTIKPRHTISMLAGCGNFLLAVTLLSMLVVIEGRLVYPVYELALTTDSINLIVIVFFGGLHTVSLMFGLALIMIGFAMRHSINGPLLRSISYVVGLLQIFGGYPWLTPLWFNIVAITGLWIWTLTVGLWLVRGAHQVIAQSD